MQKKLLLASLLSLSIFCSNAYAEENIKTLNLKQKEKSSVNENTKLIKLEKTGVSKTDVELDESDRYSISIEDDTIYSESNMLESKRNSSRAIDVITLDEIEEQNVNSLRDMLEMLPGVNAPTKGSIGSHGDIKIRGSGKFRVTMDGIRINAPFSNTASLRSFLTDDLERIEVLRGPQGNINGNGAQAGSLNLFTRKGYGPLKVELESGMGAFATFRESANLSGGNESYDYYLGITRIDSNGGTKPNINARKSTYRDDFGSLSVSSNIGKRILKGKAEVRNTFRFINAKKNVPLDDIFGTGQTQLDLDDYAKHLHIVNSTLFTHNPYKWYDYNFRLGYYKEKYKSVEGPDVDMGLSVYETDNDRLSFSTQHNIKPFKFYTLQLGHSLESNFFNTDSSSMFSTYKFDKNNLQNDVFVNNIINIKDTLIVRAGTRILNDSKWGTYGSPNVSGALILPTFGLKNAYTKVRSSYGYSVNAPTLAQIYHPLYGNTALQPEKLNGWDLGVEQNMFNGKFVVDAGVFSNDYTNLIKYVGNMSSGSYQNFGRAKTSGFESSVKISPNRFVSLNYNYTYTDSNNGEGDSIIDVPNNMHNFLISLYPHERLSLYTKASTNSSRVTFSSPVRGFFNLSMGGNLRLCKLLGSKLLLFGQLNNILNDKYELSPGYRNPGITFMAGIKLEKTLGREERL